MSMIRKVSLNFFSEITRDQEQITVIIHIKPQVTISIIFISFTVTYLFWTDKTVIITHKLLREANQIARMATPEYFLSTLLQTLSKWKWLLAWYPELLSTLCSAGPTQSDLDLKGLKAFKLASFKSTNL